jgi:hypothetical protein
MPLPLTSKDVSSRLRDYSKENYQSISAIMKGVALSVGAVVVLQIAASPGSEWVRVVPWLTSFAALLVSYVTWSRGVILVNSRANLFDNTLPFLMGTAEFALFSVLYKSSDTDASTAWLSWLLCLSVHSLFGAMIVDHRLRITSISRDYERKLRPLASRLEDWLRRDRFGALLAAEAAFALWLAERYLLFPGHNQSYCGAVQSLIAVPFLIGLIIVASKADKQRKEIDLFVSQLILSERDAENASAKHNDGAFVKIA